MESLTLAAADSVLVLQMAGHRSEWARICNKGFWNNQGMGKGKGRSEGRK